MPFICPTPITSPKFTLRLVEATDVRQLMAINGDEEVTRYLPYATWKSAADGEAWFARMSNLVAAGATLQWVIVERASNRIVGTCLLFRYDEASARAELGYVLGRAHWGKGVMAEALRALLTHAFGSLGLRRIEAEVNPDNIASNRLLVKLGFTAEGLLRGRWVTKGVVTDTNIYGLLREEWRTRAS